MTDYVGSLSLPPSANSLVMPIRCGRFARLAKTPLAKAWLDAALKVLPLREPLAGPLRLDCTFIVERVNCDTDNRLKALLDALVGRGWLYDDSQVTCILAIKRVAETREASRVDFTLYPDSVCHEATAARLAASKRATS